MVDTPTPAGPLKHSRWMRKLILTVFLSVLVVVALSLGYLWLALSWSYSDGERAGILQKFSRRGWVCKTYEGELAMSIVPGLNPTIWDFSVRDDTIAAQLNQALGRRVVLHYREHRGLPSSCFGETSYFVDGIRIVE